MKNAHNSNHPGIESAVNAILSKVALAEISNKDVQQAYSAFEKVLSDAHHSNANSGAQILYSCFLKLFSAALRLPDSKNFFSYKHQNVYKIFYSMIRLNNEEPPAKMKILIVAAIEECLCPPNRKPIIQKSILKLVLKAAEKDWSAEIVTVWVNFYLQRLESILVNQNNQKNAKDSLDVLAELSSILTQKYKYQTTVMINRLSQTLKDQTKLSVLNYYLLLQMKGNPAFIMTILRQSHFSLPKERQSAFAPKNLHYAMMRQFIDCFLLLFYANPQASSEQNSPPTFLFHEIDLLPKLYPHQTQQVWADLLLYIFLNPIDPEIIIQSVIKSQQDPQKTVNKSESITNISILDSSKITEWAKHHYQQKNRLIQILCLLYRLSKDKSKCQPLIQTLINMVKTHKQQHYLETQLQDSLEMIDYQIVPQFIKNDAQISVIQQFTQGSGQLKSELQNLNNEQIFQIFNILLQKSKSIQSNWVQTNKLNSLKKFPNLSYQLFNLLNMIPKSQIPGKISSDIRQSVSDVIKRCLEVLGQVFKYYPFEVLVPILKKSLEVHYDKINDFTIRENVKRSNIFFVKVLLITNVKVKSLSQILLRTYNEEQLNWVFTKVPKEVLPQYVRYLTTKDKLKFRWEIFDRKMQNYEPLVREPVGRMVI